MYSVLAIPELGDTADEKQLLDASSVVAYAPPPPPPPKDDEPPPPSARGAKPIKAGYVYREPLIPFRF